jgi:hypothetical protein
VSLAEKGSQITSTMISWQSTWLAALPFIVFWWLFRAFYLLICLNILASGEKPGRGDQMKLHTFDVILMLCFNSLLWLIPARPLFLTDSWRLTAAGIETPSDNFKWPDIREISASYKYDSLGLWIRSGSPSAYEKKDNHRAEIDITLMTGEKVLQKIPFNMTLNWGDDEDRKKTCDAWIRAAANWAPHVLVKYENNYESNKIFSGRTTEKESLPQSNRQR